MKRCAETSTDYRPSDVAVSLLLYGSTLYFSSNAVLLGVLVLLATTRKVQLRERAKLLLVGAFSLLALLNIALHLHQVDLTRHASSPAVVLVTAAAALAPLMRLSTLRIFVAFTCMEALVGAFQFATGSVALSGDQSELAGQELSLESELLYDLRVFGLSANSSLLAEKVFISIILTLSLPQLYRRRWLPLALLAVGLFVSFNRTAILCTLLFLLLTAASRNWRWPEVLVGVAVLAAFGVVLMLRWEYVLLQLTRDSGAELSYSELSRLYFWERSLQTIAENPLFGNGSLTFRIDDPVTGLPQHAHNSFLMLFATHGAVIPLLLLAYVALCINRDNWRAVVAFSAFSLTQYFVFWNISVPDLVFFWLLGQSRRPQPESLGNSERPAQGVAAESPS